MSQRPANWRNLLLIELFLLGSGALMIWVASGLQNERVLNRLGAVLIVLGILVLIRSLLKVRL
jgi:hypothetical protein